ncbi:MAG TPA: A/G-specific adenine glycosylase [Anaerolineales bacterium]|nr:A/G-specific adenine glycosylase [Anaerolineales bacterium]
MTEFSRLILDWYAAQGRKLPWRNSPDPYAVWVSEIMLQQTRVEAVLPYFARWMERFPTVADLAAASQQEVLTLWEGLGYYSRARNLHKAAGIVVDEHAGRLPSDPAALRRLPGIGRYTAGAIASMAFGQDVATLDGNIRRVLARAFDVAEPADSSAGERLLWKLAEEHLPGGRAGDYNQALMDLGATVCLPRNPTCLVCPLTGLCRAYQLGIQEQRPVLKPRAEAPHYVVTAAVIRRDGKVLLAKRPAKGLLGGLWEFPGGKVEEGESLEACLKREILEELGATIRVVEPFGVYEHAYTHFRITLHAFLCELAEGEPRALQADELAWVAPEGFAGYPMGKVDRLIARRIGSRQEE